MKSPLRSAALIGAATALVLIPASVAAADSPSGSPAHPGIGQAVPTVFIQTDNPDGNQVIVLAQPRDGRLSQDAAVSTGGLGGIAAGSAADHLASQGSLTYDAEHHLLLAVNAGSDTISVLSVQQRHVRLDEVLSSGGAFPNSVAVHDNLVYVLNAGGAGSVSGFRILGNHLVPMPGSTSSLGLANTNPPFFLDAPGQVAFSPDGSELLVSTKAASNSIDVFQVGPRGLLSTAPTVNADGTNVPFSFASTPSGQLVVAEPGPSALHTFSFGPNGTLTSLSASVSDGAERSLLGDRCRRLLLRRQRRQRRPQRLQRGHRRDALTARNDGSCRHHRRRIHRPDRLSQRKVPLRRSRHRRRG